MRIVVISGGSSGIGKACVDRFLANGDYVYNLDIAEDVSLKERTQYCWIKTDVRQRSAIVSAVDKLIAEQGRVDVLITSAGQHLSATIENTSEQALSNIIQLNLLGVFWLTQSVVKQMRKNGGGKIITIGSDQCLVAKPNSSAYGMTKAAILSLTKSIALDYATDNIQANCIGAGTIDTPLYRRAINAYAEKSGIALEKIEKEEADQQPAGRIGQATEIASVAFFLSQGEVNFITGALLPVDGGYTTQ